MSDIQFTPLHPRPVPVSKTPQWVIDLAEWLGRHMAPIDRWLVTHWRAIEYTVLGVVGLSLAWLIWTMVRGWLRTRRGPVAAVVDEWRPDAVMAKALLADADRLAAEGRFDEAVHLLLRRSFDDIADTRPDWLTPASTAREIARLAALPAAARSAFGVIAGEVERSRYALSPLGPPDWTRARAAYADFAVPRRGAAA